MLFCSFLCSAHFTLSVSNFPCRWLVDEVRESAPKVPVLPSIIISLLSSLGSVYFFICFLFACYQMHYAYDCCPVDGNQCYSQQGLLFSSLNFMQSVFITEGDRGKRVMEFILSTN
jgi:hypothetical protein